MVRGGRGSVVLGRGGPVNGDIASVPFVHCLSAGNEGCLRSGRGGSGTDMVEAERVPAGAAGAAGLAAGREDRV